jgi:hypothetical protein
MLLADRRLQGTLLVHTLVYWFYCLFSVCLIAMCWIVWTTRPSSSAEMVQRLWLNFGPALLGSVLLLPLVLMDCLRLTNRFAGPMVRIRRAMQQLAEGRVPEEVHVREGDFWQEFAGHLNQVIRRTDALGPVAPADAAVAAGTGKDPCRTV